MVLRTTLAALSLLALPLALTGCDNPACIYAPNGCRQAGDTESLGSQPALPPGDGAWIETDQATVEGFAPEGSDAHPETPIAITFNESLNPASLGGAFEIIEATLGQPIPFLDPPPVIGDGRMVILDPVVPLQLGSSYLVRFTESGQASDLTGQLVNKGSDLEIGSFAVAASTPTTPDVIATFPADRASRQSDIGEVVVVFDREMDDTLANPFDTDSWSVTVDGVAPNPNPDPEPLALATGPVNVEINSVWRWASEDPLAKNRPTLGAGGEVQVELSLPGNKLVDEDGVELPATVFEYDIAPVAAPAIVQKAVLSDPQDAIGRPNLQDVVPVLQAQLWAMAEEGDILDLFLFGEGPSSGETVALARSVTIDSPTMLVDVLPGALKLLSEGEGVVADGDLHIAARMRRGANRTAVRLLDLEPLVLGAQPLLFDVTAPKLLGLGGTGTTTSSFASDVRHLVVVGRADERIGRVDVSASSGEDNAGNPAVIMSGSSGLFVAQPVLLGTGVVDPAAPVTYTVRIYDRALNPQTGSVTGTFLQRGAVVGPDPGGGTVDVRVFDPRTQVPVPGALVMVHQDDGGAYSAVAGGVGTTDAAGLVTLPAAALGAETIVTVDHEDYDLWTMHGVPSEALGVPLRRIGVAEASTEGSVLSSFPLVNLTTFTNVVGDSRRPDDLVPLIEVDSCGVDAQAGVYDCPFGPAAIGSSQIGAQFFLSGDFTVNVGTFTPIGFLRAFGTRFPLLPVGSGGEETGAFTVSELLAVLDAEQQPLAMPPQALDVAGTWAPNLGGLVDHPTVTIEAISPGLPDAVPVGLGVAFDTGGGPGPWAVRGAYPGVVDGIDDGGGDQLGELVTGGTLQADLFVRVEAEDTDGNRVGARPRFSHDDSILDPPDLPLFTLPGPGGGSGAPTFLIAASDVIPDAFGMSGLYRYQVQGPGARAWTLWRPDPAGSAGVTTLVPDIAGDFGGTPLPAGSATLRISAYAWQDLDLSSFLWTDVEREHEVFAHTFPIPFLLED